MKYIKDVFVSDDVRRNKISDIAIDYATVIHNVHV